MRGRTSNTRVHESAKKDDVMLPDDHSMTRSTTRRSILASSGCFDSFPCMSLDIKQPKVAVVMEGILIERGKFTAYLTGATYQPRVLACHISGAQRTKEE
jgi:hypothetical protein